MFTVVSFSFCAYLVFSFCRKEKRFLHFHFFFFFYYPRTFDFFENFGPIPWYVGSLDGQMPDWLALQKASNPPPIQLRIFKNFPMRQTVYSKSNYPTKHNWNCLEMSTQNVNILLNTTESLRSCNIVLSRKPTFTGIFKGSQILQRNNEYRSNDPWMQKE